MEQGSLPERYLSRSVIKHIRRLNPKLSVSAAVGNDYANLQGNVSADGIGDTPWIAWVKAMNNFACSGGQIEGARLTMLLPQNVKESWIKGYMADFNSYAEAKGIQILGGHTQVSEVFARAQDVYKRQGKDNGMMGQCWPDRLIGTAPHFYYYYIGNPSEAMIAKRRTHATIISYQAPALKKSGIYGELQELKETIAEYRESMQSCLLYTSRGENQRWQCK